METKTPIILIALLLLSGCICFSQKQTQQTQAAVVSQETINISIQTITNHTEVTTYHEVITPVNTSSSTTSTTFKVTTTTHRILTPTTTDTTSTSTSSTTTSSTGTTGTTLEHLTRQQKEDILNVKPVAGSIVAYQKGFFDCRDKIIKILELRKSTGNKTQTQ